MIRHRFEVTVNFRHRFPNLSFAAKHIGCDTSTLYGLAFDMLDKKRSTRIVHINHKWFVVHIKAIGLDNG